MPFVCEIENFCIRLLKALKQNERICIYSDYDTDAVTATATMYQGLQTLGFDKNNLSFYAPDRFTEGYGINCQAVENLSKEYDLIISVDCGVNSVLEAEVVKKSSGCDMIITDHHQFNLPRPDCVAVINPRLAEFYQQKQIIYPQIYNNLQLEEKEVELLKDWLTKVQKRKEIALNNSENLLSTSVTGVGVAWFCLVWLGYFLYELKILDNN